MKIALFTDNFLPGVGGTENVVLRLALEYVKVGHEVVVFAPSYHRPICDAIKLPFPVICAKSVGFDNNYRAFPGKNISLALDRFSPDVIHVKTFGAMSNFGIRYAKAHSIPVVSTIHTNYVHCYKDVFKFDFLSYSIARHYAKKVSRADIITTVSDFMIRELKKYGLTRDVEVIRNGGDHVVDRLDKKTGDKFTMLYVGLVVKFKNIEFILRSLRKLKAIRSDFVFYIVGDGPDKKRYERLVKRYDLSENVLFTGRVLDRDRLNELYAKSDLFLFASRIDTDGLTVLEAGAKGTPSLVLSDMATAERIRDGETGFIVKGEESVYARKISELMDSRDLVLEVGKKAHEIFEGWDKIAEQYLDCYQRVIKK